MTKSYKELHEQGLLPAFPILTGVNESNVQGATFDCEWGLTERDMFAIHAPVDPVLVSKVIPNLQFNQLINDNDRRNFMNVWASLKYEFADAMLLARRAKEL